MADALPLAGLNVETGEVTCPDCLDLSAALSEARGELASAKGALQREEDVTREKEREIRSLSHRIGELLRDRDAEAREHELHDTALDLWNLWRHAAAHAEGREKPSRAKLNGERFFLVLPFLKKEGVEDCARAILGRTYDYFTSTRKNGSTIYYHEWERTFGDKGKGSTARSNFEECRNRCPSDWRARLEHFTPDLATRLKVEPS